MLRASHLTRAGRSALASTARAHAALASRPHALVARPRAHQAVPPPCAQSGGWARAGAARRRSSVTVRASVAGPLPPGDDGAALSTARRATKPPPPPPSPPPSFKLVPIPGDGSCLFRALAQGDHALSNQGALLSKAGLLAEGFEVRRRVCAALVRARADVEPFLECPFPAYIDAMSLEGTWGGEPELAAAPAALQRPVCVYEATARGPLGGVAALRKVSAYGVDAFPNTPPVCLLFSGAHYDLLLQDGGGEGGVGGLLSGF